jgi:hypothetical protein
MGWEYTLCATNLMSSNADVVYYTTNVKRHPTAFDNKLAVDRENVLRLIANVKIPFENIPLKRGQYFFSFVARKTSDPLSITASHPKTM